MGCIAPISWGYRSPHPARAALILAALSGAIVGAAPVNAAGSRLTVQPMTIVGQDGAGYLADPQPVHLAPSTDGHVQILSGTTKAIIHCAYPIKPGCFASEQVTVDAGTLTAEIAAAGATVTNFQNLDLFQDDAGSWHAAVTIGVHIAAHPKHWTIIAHAHSTISAASGSAPLAWAADTVLTGSFARPVEGNYDGKYFANGGRLYLLYVDAIAPPPALRNAVMLQAMLSPTRVAPDGPVTLLTPGDRDGELASEFYANTKAKLVEAPYIAQIGGKYALVYSTGAYLTPGYKAAVAWSDTLLPARGGRYRKVLQPDPQGVWGQPGRREVHYLVQSAKPRWPNFTGDQVIGPGVAAAVEGPGGAWWLYFNGFAPGDMPLNPVGKVNGDHRRPYFLRLEVRVPEGRSVEAASDDELATWLAP